MAGDSDDRFYYLILLSGSTKTDAPSYKPEKRILVLNCADDSELGVFCYNKP